MWNNSYRTPTECWQKTSGFPKGKKIPTYLGRAKEKRKNRDNRDGTQPERLVCSPTRVGGGWELRLGFWRSDPRERTGVDCVNTA